MKLKMHSWGTNTNPGERFTSSQYPCPQCQGEALRDDWPPNYWVSNGHIRRGDLKCICENCTIHFVVEYEGEQYQYKDITPLIFRDGYWLTPNDVWREDYKVIHGEYPLEAYA